MCSSSAAGRWKWFPSGRLEVRNLTVAIKNIARACGDEISEVQPALDARLEDGSRVAAMFPPCSVDGPTLTVRKFTHRYTLEELVGSRDAHCTMLAERTDPRRAQAAEHPHLRRHGHGQDHAAQRAGRDDSGRGPHRPDRGDVRDPDRQAEPGPLRGAAVAGALGQEAPLPAVTIADLLRATLRHRPDRILVGEVRGAEAFDLLQALNTGHQGALSTIHANSAEQALARLAHCVLTANVGLPHHSTREAIALAIHLVVHIDRVGRTRTVTDVVSVSGYDYASDRFRLEPVWTADGCGKGRRDDMTIPAWSRPVPLLLLLAGCGGRPRARPGRPRRHRSWPARGAGRSRSKSIRATRTRQPPSSGPMQWTFEAMPQTNLQSFRTTVRSDHPWLTMMTTATTALTPGNTPPTQISTQGEFTSPRGCRGTFGSVGTAQATRIEADFTGTDCQQATFIGRVVLTKN